MTQKVSIGHNADFVLRGWQGEVGLMSAPNDSFSHIAPPCNVHV